MHAMPFCHAQLLHDAVILHKYPRRIHHLRQPQHPWMLQEGLQVICQKGCPRVLKIRGRNAGRQHDIHIQRYILRCFQHEPDALAAADIGNLVRVSNDSGHAAGQCCLGELVRRQHGALNMHMGINQPRHNIAPLHVYFLNAKIGASPGDIAICDGYIA